MEKKHRQCPHCKSKKGFELGYVIHGSGRIVSDFKGNEIESERSTVDDMDSYAYCLSCKKMIDAQKLQID